MVDLLDHNANIEIKRLILLTTITRWDNYFFKFPNCHISTPSCQVIRISQITSTYLNIQQCKGSSIDSLLIISGGLNIKTQKWRSVQNHLIKIDGGHFILILGLFFFHECNTYTLQNLRLVVPKGRSSVDA